MTMHRGRSRKRGQSKYKADGSRGPRGRYGHVRSRWINPSHPEEEYRTRKAAQRHADHRDPRQPMLVRRRVRRYA
jgi:hypothetical protein